MRNKVKLSHLDKTITEYMLKDGRRVSVTEEGGRVSGWKRYTSGVVEVCDARYINNNTVSGTAKYDMLGNVQFINLNRCNWINSNLVHTRNVLMDYNDKVKLIVHNTYQRLKNGRFRKIDELIRCTHINPGSKKDEMQIIRQFEKNN